MAQLILFAGTLLLVRFYDPSDLGAAGAFVAGIGVMSAVGALRYEASLPIATDEEALPVLALCLAAAACTSLLAGLLAIAFGPMLLGSLDAPDHLEPLRWVVAPALFAISGVNVLTHWAIRRRDYRLLARTRILQSVVQVGGQNGLGALGAGAGGLVAGAIAGACAGGSRLARPAIAAARAGAGAVSRAAVRTVALRYRAFPTLSAPTALAQGVALVAAPLLVAVLYGLETAGLFVLAHRVVTAPVTILGEAASRTLMGDTAMSVRSGAGAATSILRRTILVLVIAAVVPTIVLVAAGPALFASVFGEAWRAAGEIAQPLCALAAAQLIAAPAAQTLVVFERLGLLAVIAAIRVVATAGALIAAHAAGASALTAITVMSVGGAISFAVGIVVSDHVARSEGSGPDMTHPAASRDAMVSEA